MITIDGVIIEEGFISTLNSKKNKDEILQYVTIFQRNRTANQFLSIDISRDVFKDKTCFVHWQITNDKKIVEKVKCVD